MPSPPPSYTAIPTCSQPTRSPQQPPHSVPSATRTHAIYGTVRLEHVEEEREQSQHHSLFSVAAFAHATLMAADNAMPCIGVFLILLLLVIGGLLIAVVIITAHPPQASSPPSPPCPALPKPSPPSISPLAPVAAVTASSSWMVFMVYYEPFNSSISSKPLSQGKLYLESRAEAPSEEVKIQVESPCEIYAIDLHAGPECKGEGEERDCQTMWSSMQVYTNLTDCRENKRSRHGLYNFGIGLSKSGSSYALEKDGIRYGTDLVRESSSSCFASTSSGLTRSPDFQQGRTDSTGAGVWNELVRRRNRRERENDHFRVFACFRYSCCRFFPIRSRPLVSLLGTYSREEICEVKQRIRNVLVRKGEMRT